MGIIILIVYAILWIIDLVLIVVRAKYVNKDNKVNLFDYILCWICLMFTYCWLILNYYYWR